MAAGRLALGLAGVGISLPSSAGADPCTQLPPPAVSVKRLDEPITLQTQHGFHILTQLAARLARPGKQILGLTEGNAVVRLDMQIQSYTDPSGRWECASPQLALTYGFQPMTIYIAREFPTGSCAYKEIHGHELRHVKAYQDHLIGIEKELNDALRRRFATGRPWRGSVGQTQARLQQEMDERWIPYIKRAIGRVETAQARIDAPEEYARIADSCNGEIRQRLR